MLKVSLFALLLVFLMGLGFGSQAWADTQTAEGIFENAKTYTVKIKTSVPLPFGDDSKGTWTGAGFVVNAKRNWVVTNAHVTSRSKAIIQASAFGGEMEPAKAVYIDPYFDIAVIEISKSKKLKDAPLDCGVAPHTGVAVGAFGHPENYNYTGTKGIISGRTSDLGMFGDYLQTDAPINPGNSGGPLINMVNGKVVGMNTAGRDKAQNMNWAVPAEQICSIVRLLREGVDPTPPRSAFDFYKDNEKKNTLKVAKLTKHGHGFEIKRDDEIVAVVVGDARVAVSNEAQLLNAVRGQVGAATLIVKRKNKEIKISGKFVPTTPAMKNRGIFFSGILLGLLENTELEQFVGIDHPVHAEFIEAGSLAENNGVEKGDIITAINGINCNSLDEAFEILNRANSQGESIVLRVQHPGFSAGRIFTYFERTLDLQDLKWVELSSSSGNVIRLTDSRGK